MRIRIPLITVGLVFLALGCMRCLGQSPQYRVLSSKEVFILDPNGAVSAVQAIDRSTRNVVHAASVTHIPTSWWDVVFPVDVFKMADPATTVDLEYNIDGKAAPSLQVSLSPKVNITIGTIGSVIREYWINSNVVLKDGSGRYVVASDKKDCGTGTGGWKSFALKDKTKTKTLHGTMQICTVPFDQVRSNPARLADIRLMLDYALILRQNSFTIDSASGNAILDGITADQSLSPNAAPIHIVFADDSTFNPQSGPTTKDAASVYANLQIAAGTGTKGAWGIDGKIASLNVPVLHGALTLLSATANTGNNTSNIKGTTYTDTIDWMLPVSWAFSISKKAPTTLTLIVGPKYETDYKFDKKNLLVSSDSIWASSAESVGGFWFR